MYIKEFDECCTHCASGIVTDGEYELYCFIDPLGLEVVDGTRVLEISPLVHSDLVKTDVREFVVKPLGRTRDGERIFHDNFFLRGEVIGIKSGVESMRPVIKPKKGMFKYFKRDELDFVPCTISEATVRIGKLDISLEIYDRDFGVAVGDFVEFTADRLDAEICPDGLGPFQEFVLD